MEKKVNKGGRPTKYSEDRIDIVFDFIHKQQDRGVPPFIEGLAFILDVTTDTVWRWANKHKRFSNAIKKLKEVQCSMLQEHGLEGKYSAPMAIFLLKNNHGFKDRTETDFTSGGKTLPAPILRVNSGGILRDNSDNKDK